MKFHSVLFVCILASVVSAQEDTQQGRSSELKNRFKIWLMSRAQRDLNSASGAGQPSSAHLVRTEDVKDTLSAHSSPADLSIRVRRSKGSVNQSWRPGCPFATCQVHTLAHRLNEMNTQSKTNTVPMTKLSPTGYGRRRRSLAGHHRHGAQLPQT